MDPLYAEIEQFVRDIQWGEVSLLLEAAIEEVLGDMTVSAPSSLPPLHPPAPDEFPGPLCGQNLNGQHNTVPVIRLMDSSSQFVHPVEYLNEKMVHPPVPPHGPCKSRKRKSDNQQDECRQYVRKPPNAFMVFRKEQRPNVVSELHITDSASVNKILGERWKKMSKAEQAKYYEEAETEKVLHRLQHPDWSSKENYGRKKKLRKASTFMHDACQESKIMPWTATPQTVTMRPPQTQPAAPLVPQSDSMSQDFLQTLSTDDIFTVDISQIFY